MKGISYNTEIWLGGPWLINRKALEELSNIIENGYKKLMKHANEMLEERVNETIEERYGKKEFEQFLPNEKEQKRQKIRELIKNYFFDKDKIINVKFEKGKYFSTDSLSKAIIVPELSNANISGFEVSYGAANINVSIVVDSDGLRIRTYPEKNELAKELFVELRDWAYRNRHPLWQRAWKNIAGFHWMIWLACFVISAPFIQTPKDIAINKAKSEVHKLIANGLSKEDTTKAIELILQIESGYAPDIENKPLFPRWFKLFFWISLIISIILSFVPKLVIGIGRGNLKIILWKKWLRLISITIPGLIFTSFLWPYISHWVLNFFGK